MSKNIEQANIKIQSLKNTLKRIEWLSFDYNVMEYLEKNYTKQELSKQKI